MTKLPYFDFSEPMKNSQIFFIFGAFFIVGFLGIMALVCLPIFSAPPNPTATLFVAIVFGISGVGSFVLSKLEHDAGK